MLKTTLFLASMANVYWTVSASAATKCGKNEVLIQCPALYCKARTCAQKGTKPFCPRISPGLPCPGSPGCVCKTGYLKGPNGDCIPEAQCQLKCPGQYEVYNPCVDKCDPNTCASIGKQYNCPLQSANASCTGGCVCEPGYYRNTIGGECVSEENCKKCTGPNEYYSCGGACDNVCETLAVRNQTNCDIINIKCNEMCYCIEGYARNKDGECVPFDQCPEKAKCGKNEVLIQCPALYCKTRTCAQKGTKPLCPRISPGLPCPGSPGCVCKTGYLKGPNGDCIPEAQCPPKCGKFEVADACANGGCYCERNCTDIGNSYKCVRPKICEQGCLCKSGYLRDHWGKCILREKCPNYSGRDKNRPIDKNCLGEYNKRKESKNDNSGEDKYNENNEDKVEYNNEGNYEDHNGTSDGNNTDDQNQFSKGIAKFSSRFIKETANNKQSDNVVTCPFSVLIPLAELALYTIGKSFNQLIQVIGLEKKSQIRTEFEQYLKGARNQENITFNLAAIVYVNDKYEMTDAFLEDTANVFGAGAETIDVEEQTNNNIKDLVSSDMITTDTRLFLINAVYFKGKWKQPFDPKSTTKRDYYVTADNIQQVDTMFLDTRVEFVQSEDLDAKILRLSYKNEKFTAVFILPNKVDGVDDLLDKIQDINKYNTALQSLRLQKVKIWLPKFRISTTIDLSEILKKLDVTDIFTSQSGLTGILKSGDQLAVTQAIQKCFIEVSEEGTEAAAANAFGVSVTSVQLDPPEFNANHPFVFALHYNGDTMFNGVHRKPSTE